MNEAMIRRRHATLQDVADRAGVSIATASRHINGIKVAPESARLVDAAADELAYVPNDAARSLHASGTMTIGMVVPTLEAQSTVLIEAIAAELGEAGYTLLTATALGDDQAYEVIVRRLIERRVDGVFCMQPPILSKIIDRYRASGVPILALLHRAVGQEDMPLVGGDFERPASAMFRRLHELGHRNGLAIFRHAAADQSIQYIRAADRAGVALSITMSEAPGAMPGNVAQAVHASPDAPSFVIAPGNLALQIQVECERNGLRVPDDLSVIGVAGYSDTTTRPNFLASLTVDLHALGKLAGRTMIAALQGHEPGSDITEEIVVWVEGRSVGVRLTPKRQPTHAGRG